MEQQSPAPERHNRYHPLLVLLLVFVASNAIFVLEIMLDKAFGIGEGIIYTWNFHSKIILFHFLINTLAVTYFLLKSKRNWLKNLGLAILSVLIILTLIELVFFVLLCFRTDTEAPKLVKTYIRPPNVKSYSIFAKPDTYLGYKPESGSFSAACELVKGKDTQSVYNVTYEFDESGRRLMPRSAESPGALRYALFFGGSFTMGEGLEADETLPYFFQQLDTSVVAYNYGFSGYGTSQVLSRLRYSELTKEVPEKDGLLIYTFIDDHIKRAYGFHNFQVSYGAKSPSYKWKYGRLEFKGTFMRANPPLHYFYFLLNNSNFLAYYNIDLPPAVGAKQYSYVARIIEACFEDYKKQFGNENFYLLIYPGNSDEITNYINEPAIKVLNYSNLFEDVKRYTIYPPYENHPNESACQKVAEQLHLDLR